MELKVDYSKNKMDRSNDHIDGNNFRRGWEACLEALRKEGVHFKKGEWTDDSVIETTEPGTEVFIPDE